MVTKSFENKEALSDVTYMGSGAGSGSGEGVGGGVCSLGGGGEAGLGGRGWLQNGDHWDYLANETFILYFIR